MITKEDDNHGKSKEEIITIKLFVMNIIAGK